MAFSISQPISVTNVKQTKGCGIWYFLQLQLHVFTTLTTAVFLSANMFSFPTLGDLKIVDGNLLACQAEFNLRGIPKIRQNNLVWLLAFLNQYRLQTSNRLKAAAFGISYNYNYVFYLPVQC